MAYHCTIEYARVRSGKIPFGGNIFSRAPWRVDGVDFVVLLFRYNIFDNNSTRPMSPPLDLGQPENESYNFHYIIGNDIKTFFGTQGIISYIYNPEFETSRRPPCTATGRRRRRRRRRLPVIPQNTPARPPHARTYTTCQSYTINTPAGPFLY